MRSKAPDGRLLESYITGMGQKIVTHAADRCQGEFCVIHRPMPGPWDSWPTLWRSDRRIMERLCTIHGVGHPAVEQLDFWLRQGRGYEWVHGCCGCPCHPSAADPGWHDRWTTDAE